MLYLHTFLLPMQNYPYGITEKLQSYDDLITKER